jgi:phytanoyl-CoA hydroxylase
MDLNLETAKIDFQKNGYVILRQVIPADLAKKAAEHVEWLRAQHPDLKPENLHHGLVKDDPFWHYLISQPKLVDIAQAFLGDPDGVALFASHYIAKSPKTGLSTLPHQDGAYWPLAPMNVVTLWLAVTTSDRTNGCMKAIPGSHLTPLQEMIPNSKDDNLFQSGIDESLIDESKMVYFEMQPGDLSIHDPNLIHGSDANKSDTWRIGLTIRYIPTTTKITVDEAGCPFLLRGQAIPGVNKYLPRPIYSEKRCFQFDHSKDYP